MALVIETIEPLPARLGLLLGDVANNFRASLDHLAWTLATTRGRRAPTAKEENRIYFPLAMTARAFDEHLLPSVFLRPGDRRTVRRFQPFWHTARSRPHPIGKIPMHCLAILNSINRTDKHRTVQPVWAWPTGGRLLIGEAHDCRITRVPQKAQGIVLQPGAEVQRVFVRRTGRNPDVDIEAQLNVTPTIDGRVAVDVWLAQTHVHVSGLLLQFATPPPEVLALAASFVDATRTAT